MCLFQNIKDGNVIATLENGLKPKPTNGLELGPQLKKAVKLSGPPSGGKGIVSEYLKSLGGTHYSSSAALREYAKRLDLKEVLKQMEEGDLIELEHVQLVSGWHFLDFVTYDERKFGIFDGWGRVRKELDLSLPFLKERADTSLVFLEADDECLLERSRKRGRVDDGAIAKRIRIYRENFKFLYDGACKHLGEEHVHIIDTTELNVQGVQEKVALSLGLLH